MEWWIIALLFTVLALLLVGPVTLVAFGIYGIRYWRGENDCERAAGRWLKVFVLWAVPVIGMIIAGMADTRYSDLTRELARLPVN
ncbi:MAG: hypothetical protein AB7O49_00745 [Sphingomonadales bacterium]